MAVFQGVGAAMKHSRPPVIACLMLSRAIRDFNYDAAEHRLDVEFVSGRRYSYFDVPEELVADMQAASSKGGFFNRRVRDHYHFIRQPPFTRR